MTDDAVDALLLNVIIVISGPLFMELSSYEKTKNKKILNLVLTLLIMSAELLLCTQFPFHLMRDGLGQYDLRTVPLISGLFYGGNLVGIVLFLEFATIRLFVGGPMGVDSAAIYLVTIILGILLRKKFISGKKAGKLGVASLPMATTLVLSYAVVGMLRGHTLHETVDFGLYGLVNFATLWLTVLMMEYSSDKSRMQEEIQVAEKFRVIAELAASIAHEIRNPMTVARGFLQLIQQNTDAPPDPVYTSTAIRELDRAHEIIEQYLSLARPSKDNAILLEPGCQLKYAVEVLRPYAMLRNVTIDYALTESCMGHIRVDAQKFLQMIVNIAKNGIEAMPNGGRLAIVQHVKDSSVIIQISDSGSGMTDEVLSRLGEPYYSTKTGGTGLGLMASYRICQSMKGHIVVQSELGRGTTFTIKIPLSDTPSPRANSLKV